MITPHWIMYYKNLKPYDDYTNALNICSLFTSLTLLTVKDQSDWSGNMFYLT